MWCRKHCCRGNTLFTSSTLYNAELIMRFRRNLAGEIGEEWEAREGKSEPTDDLLALVKQIVPYHMGHNAETDAVDLLLEVSSICGTNFLSTSVSRWCFLCTDFISVASVRPLRCFGATRAAGARPTARWALSALTTPCHGKADYGDANARNHEALAPHTAGPSCEPVHVDRQENVDGYVPGRLQVDQLDLLADYVDSGNYARTCLYLTSTSAYLPEPDDHLVLVKARRHL